MNNNLIYLATLLLLINLSSISPKYDENKCHNNFDVLGASFGNQIKSIKVYKTGSELSEPIIELGSNESITLIFDDLSDSSKNYSYTIVHCSSDWKESGLIKSDYMDGFDVNPINDYQNSYATRVPYTHYKFQIPNTDLKIKISGNYIIRVVDTYNNEKILFEQKFMVVEPILKLNTKLRQPLNAMRRLTSQQLELSILTDPLNISNPNKEVTLAIFQNLQPDNSLYRIHPVFIRANEIVYTSPDNLLFDGINEYRSFDINSIHYISSGIKSIDQIAGEYSIQLQSSENNRNQKYTNQPDINGRYAVKLERSELSEIEADYVWVYFTMPYYDQLPDKEVYVYGELTDWQCKPQNRMQYNYQREAYELRLFLKQGYYNYRYVVRDIKTGELDQTFFEGNHFKTENSYLILVYYKQPGKQYDRIVGIKRINSKNSP